MGNFPVLRGLRKTPPETCMMAQDHARTVKIFFVIDSIRFKCFGHPPYSPDNGPNRYLSFYVRLVTFKLLEIWKHGRPIFVSETMKIISNFDGLFYMDICNK